MENRRKRFEKNAQRELRRVGDICHQCRRCLPLCPSFPKLFELVDASEDEIAGLAALVGRAAALEILLEGRVFGAREAKDKGLVTRIVPDADAAARTFPVMIRLPNADGTLQPGMSVVTSGRPRSCSCNMP